MRAPGSPDTAVPTAEGSPDPTGSFVGFCDCVCVCVCMCARVCAFVCLQEYKCLHAYRSGGHAQSCSPLFHQVRAGEQKWGAP